LIRLTCDPEKLDEISAACQEVISAYVSQGPSGTELASAKLQLLNQIDRDQQSLMYWLNKLARIEFNGSTMESQSTSGPWFAISQAVKICGASSKFTSPRNVASWS
jgi:predicted Zn-dependent peptidase